MGWYIGRRLLQMVPVFFGATLLIYALVFALPGDPIRALFGDKPVSPTALALLRAQYHLDKPFFVQYLYFLKGVFTLDFGTSFSGQPVISQITRAFPVTIKLAIVALVIEAVFGIVFGFLAGLRRGGIFDSTVLFLSLVVIGIPVFVLGFVGQYFIGIKWGIARATVGGDPAWVDLILPGAVLGALSFAYVLRLTRNSVAEGLSADHVRTATAKGLSRPRVMTVHVLRNSLIPVITFLGTDLGALMGGAVVTEGIFNVPGVGNLLYQSVIRQEGPTVVSVVTILVLVYLIANLVVDLLYAVLDPRIRYV
ncbi:ABC transporter permease [Kineococcus rhizosphaerae]|uniref:Oligopeptide transport system permease protein n=1 Tax=Kineococcus rhizosphaerae TaxID=559628 RepID=A0A2T0R484_9ACTN|nr:ABC transporter permease [Kineococcus rhizosphaerae]PRY15178.1 oligopeptide transport system permease protein [Kineococcus rhizosphaerae]